MYSVTVISSLHYVSFLMDEL